MRILVTGGAGFIGSHLCDLLVAKGCSVLAIDNLSLGKLENIKHLSDHPKFEFRKIEMLDLDDFRGAFDQPFDCVFHLAANSDISRSHDEPQIDLDKTFMTTFNTLLMMKEFGIQKIFFASTSAVYGEADIKIKETHGPLVPISHYGAGKLASEAFIYSFGENYDIQAWVTRFPNVVGGRATHGAIFDFIHKLKKNPKELTVLGDGTQEKPYLYVKDLVQAMWFVFQNAKDKVNIFNIGVTSKTTVKEIAEMVIKAMKLDAKIAYTGGKRGWIGDVPKFEYDISKLTALGWKSERDSNEAVWQAVLDNIN